MPDRKAITPRQCAAARMLLGWKQADLSAASGASKRAISDFESGKTVPRRVTLDALEAAFIVNGLTLLDAGGVAIEPIEQA